MRLTPQEVQLVERLRREAGQGLAVFSVVVQAGVVRQVQKKGALRLDTIQTESVNFGQLKDGVPLMTSVRLISAD